MPIASVSTSSDLRTASGGVDEAVAGILVSDRQVEAARAQLLAAEARTRERQATARLIDDAGHPLPVGLRLASADGSVSAWVAKEGFSAIVGGDMPTEVTGTAAEHQWSCTLPPVPTDTTLPDLGEIVCR